MLGMPSKKSWEKQMTHMLLGVVGPTILLVLFFSSTSRPIKTNKVLLCRLWEN